MTTTPTASYRVELGPDRPFAAAQALLPHLERLGTTHLRIPSVLAARPGAADMGDVADHTRVDLALGGEEGLRALADAARARGIVLVADLIPARMAIGPWNPVWDALLRDGRSSDAAKHVDVDWETPLPGAADKVVLPVLDGPYGEELAAGRIGLEATPAGTRVTYGEVSFPVNAESEAAASRTDVTRLQGTPGEPRTWVRMHSLLEQQHYRLVSRRAGSRLVNYRRLGARDDLAAVDLDDPIAFGHAHDLVLGLVAEGVLGGLCVRDVDALADPGGYLAQLRDAVGPDVSIWLDRPDQPRDPLPEGWPVQGTTGAELQRVAVALQVDPHGMRHLTALARAVGADPGPAEVREVAARRLDADLGPDLRWLVRVVWTACQDDHAVRDVDYRTVLEAVSRLLAAVPVRRPFVSPDAGEVRTADRDAVARAVDVARQVDGPGDVPDALWSFLGLLLSGQVRWTSAATEAVRRFQQLAGAVAGLTADEVQARHAAMPAVCETACDHAAPSCTLAEAHELLQVMPPQGLRATALPRDVHGEDLRMRLAALAGIAAPWSTAAERVLARTSPADPGLALRLLHVAAAAWPLADDGRASLADVLAGPAAGGQPLLDRLLDHAAALSARSGGGDGTGGGGGGARSDGGYAAAWLREVLDPDGDVAAEIRAAARRAAEVGMAMSLSQVLLRTTAGGVPECLHGAERWDERLIGAPGGLDGDPDEIAAAAEAWAATPPDAAELWAGRRDGAIKQWVLQRALEVRRRHAAAGGGAFASGIAAAPLPASGRWAAHLLLAHRPGGSAGDVVAVCPRVIGRVTDGGRFPPLGRIWADTEVQLPEVADGSAWLDVLSGHTVPAGSGVAVADLLVDLPVALLVPADLVPAERTTS